MSKVIMIGCDLHERSMLLKVAVDTEPPRQLSYENDASGRRRMIHRLKGLAEKCNSRRIVFVYEASGLGHGLSDQLHEEGIECHVLSPTHLPKTPKGAKLKTDARDAQMLLEQVRGFVLAGNSLPVVWTPPQRLRDDRELVRARVDVADEMTRIKLKIRSLLKRYDHPANFPTKTKWTKAHLLWLREEIVPGMEMTVGVKLRLLLDRLEMYRHEQGELDKALKKLSQENRYRDPCRELRKLPGVGLLVSMTFLTEMGDMTRFHNRREVAAYLGLCPSSHESGETSDRKGRITRQGPARLRKVLCQAAWVSISKCDQVADAYHRIRQNQKNRTKKALVALMRKLGIRMWHCSLRCGVSEELLGRGGPHALEEVFNQTRRQEAASPGDRPLACVG